MNWYEILAFAVIIGVATEYAYGEDMVFEKVDGSNYFHLGVSEVASVYLRIGDKSLQFEEGIKLDNDGKFSIRHFDDNMRVFVFPSNDDSYKAITWFVENGQINRIDFKLNQLDISPYEKPIKENLLPLEKLTASEILTGLDSVERLEKIKLDLQRQQELLAAQNVTITPRSEYTLSEDKELELVVRSDFHVPIMTTFNFDLRAIDPQKNLYHDFYGLGEIGDVIIIGNVTDAEGKLWMSINSTTNSNGYFESQGLYIPDNTSTRGEWSLSLNAIKYFDDDKTFSTFDVVEPFFIVNNIDGSTTKPPILIKILVGSSIPNCDYHECYSLTDISIKVGDTIEWLNMDSESHTLKFGDPFTKLPSDFSIGPILPNDKFQHTFTTVGIYDYYSQEFTWMDGRIIVVE